MKGKNGFSLIEAIVAMLLTIMMVMFVFTMFPTTRQALQLSENHINAAALGRTLLSQARQAGFDNVAAASGTQTLTGTDNGLPFTRTLNYQVNIQNVNASKKYVWAVISWSEGGQNKQVTVETIMVKP